MKKTIISIAVALVVIVLSLLGVKALLFGGAPAEAPAPSALPAVQPTERVEPKESSVVNEHRPAPDDEAEADPVAPSETEAPVRTPEIPEVAEGKTLYDNGMASFQYDDKAVFFTELPSDKDNGIPMTSFLLLNSEDVLPRVDFMPLTVSASGEGPNNFYNITEDEWTTLARALVVGYYPSSGQAAVNVTLADQIVKVDGTTAKLYASFASRGDDGTCFDGSVRLIANGTNAVASLALAPVGQALPAALNDVYMSVEVH